MDLFDALRMCVRRWYVFVPVLMLGVLGAWRFSQTIAPTYASSGQISVLPQAAYPVVPQGVTVIRQNPYGPVGAGQTASALAIVLQNEQTRQALATPVRYSVSTENGAPILNVYATGEEPEATRATVDAVLEAAPVRLQALQEEVGAPADQLYQMQVLATAEYPEEVGNRPLKALLAGIVLAAGLAVGAALLVHGIIQTRTGRRSRRPERVDGRDAGVDLLLSGNGQRSAASTR